MTFFCVAILLLFNTDIFKFSNCQIELPECAAWSRHGITITGQFDGTSGTSKEHLNTPYGFYCRQDDDFIYATDMENDRMITFHMSGRLQTNGGTDDYPLNKPTSTHITPTGVYYIADSKNARIQRWDLNNKVITTVVGKLGQFSNTNETFGGGFLGIHLDMNEGLYVSDSSNHRLMYFLPNKTQGILVAGTGQAGSANDQLNEPMFFYVDSNRTLFIADTKNQRIQKWIQNSTSGTTVADRSSPLFLKEPRSLTMDNHGNMYIVDAELSQVLKWNPSSKKASCIIGCSGIAGNRSDQLNHPTFISFYSNKSIIISDTGNNRLQFFNFYIDQNCLKATPKCRGPLNVTITPEYPLYILSADNKIPRDQPIEFSISTTVNCNSLSHIDRIWSILSCEKLGYGCFPNSHLENLVSTLLSQNTSDLYIPPFGFQKNGYYLIQCEITVQPYGLQSLVSSFIQIIQCEEIYFVENQFIHITIRQSDLLQLEPVKYSLKTDNLFKDRKTDANYHCRLYPNYTYLYANQQLVNIGNEEKINSTYSRCLKNAYDFQYNRKRSNFSLIIKPNTLSIGNTYEFQISFLNGVLGKILVYVIDSTWSFSIGIKCADYSCPIIDEYYEINNDDKIRFQSFCSNNCSVKNYNISWKISGGKQSLQDNTINWLLLENNRQGNGVDYQTITIDRQWFQMYSYADYLFLEVYYHSSNEKGYGFSYIKIQHSLLDEICSIAPMNGSTKTLFNIQCFPSAMTNDEKGEYTVFIYLTNNSLGTFTSREFNVYLPMGDPTNIFSLSLFIEIRHRFQKNQQFYLPPITVTPDIDTVMNTIVHASIFIQGNRSQVSQQLTSLTSVLEFVNLNQVQQLLNLDVLSFYISSLDQTRLTFSSDNRSISFDQYQVDLNQRAISRHKLISLYKCYHPETISSLLLVSSTINQLIANPNELLISSLIIVADKCQNMTKTFDDISLNSTISKDQIEKLVNQLTKCISNILTAIHGPLLNRSIILDNNIDELTRSRDEDYYDLYSRQDKLFYYQKQYADLIEKQTSDTMDLLDKILDRHLNVNEEMKIKNSKIDFSFSKQKSNQSDEIFYHKTIRTPLVQYGINDKYVKYSNSYSVSIYDKNRIELNIFNENKYLIEFFIIRDVNMKTLLFRQENLLEKNHPIYFIYYKIPLIENKNNLNLTYSFHFEFESLNRNLSYILIYKFNSTPTLNSNDGFIYFCSKNINDYHRLFLNNLSTKNNQQFIHIVIRELNTNEACQIDRSLRLNNMKSKMFTSNYQYRYYSSACFYRDENKQWQTNGLIVGSKTNLTHTHCFSHRL